MLDHGARVIAESKRVVKRAAQLGEATRQLIFTFTPRRFRAMSGGSGPPAAAVQWRTPPRSITIRIPHVEHAVCDKCGRPIADDEALYEISNDHEKRLDLDCFKSFLAKRA